MSMQQVFQDLIDFCLEPPASGDLQETHVLAFHLDSLANGDDVYPFNGPAIIRHHQGLNSFFLEGYGITNPVANHPAPNDGATVVHLGLQIGRFNTIESVLEFSGMSDLGGFNPDQVIRTEDCDATAEQIGDEVAIFFESSAGRRGASLRKTNVLHNKSLA